MSERAKRWATPAALLLGALIFRLALAPGMHVTDDLYYRAHAHDLLSGTFEPDTHFKARVAFIAILAVCERLFGVNDLSGILFTIACGVLTVGAVYWVANQLGGRAAAVAAGVTAACIPNEIFWGGIAFTDIPAGTFMALSAAFFISAVRSGRRLDAAAAGLALGAAHLMRESAVLLFAFFGAAWLCRRARLRPVVLAGLAFAGILLVEMSYFKIVRDDWLGRFHAATGASFTPEVIQQYTPDLTARLTYEIPSMMFNPFDDRIPYFALTFILAGLSAAVLLWKRDGRAWMPLLWWGALFVAIMFVPFSLSPFRPAVLAYEKNLAPMTAAAAVVIGLGAAVPTGRRRWIAWALVVLAAAAGLLSAWKLRQDSALRTAGPRAAHAFVDGRPCVTDPRTSELFRYWNGFDETRVGEFGDAGAEFAVHDEQWIDFLGHHYGYEAPRPEPGWPLVFETRTPARRSIRGFLMGRRAVGEGPATRVYRVTD